MTSLKLPVNADMNQIAELKEDFIISLQAREKMTIDASAVETISTPLLQLLLIAQQDAKKNDLPFAIKNPSKRFLFVVKDFGCLDYFQESLT